MKVRIQVIKVYDIEIDADDADQVIILAYQMQTTEIEAKGKLVDAMTDHAETEEEVEASVEFLRQASEV